MHAHKRNDFSQLSTSDNKFLALLNQNRINAFERKQLLESKSKHLRGNKSHSTNNLQTPWQKVKQENLDKEAEKISKVFYHSENQEPIEDVDMSDFRARLRTKTNGVRDKIAEKLLKNKTNLLLMQQPKTNHQKSLGRAPSFFIRTVAEPKNFCDFYAFTQSNWTEGQAKENCFRMFHCRRQSQNPNEFRNSQKYSPAKKKLQDTDKEKLTSTDSSQKRLSHRIKSVFSKKSFIPKLQQGSEGLFKLNTRDSSFFRKYFKLKNELFENQEDTLVFKQKVVEEMGQFIKENYKSYWMSSIEDLLAQDAIENIRFGYYCYKSINLGPFKLMSDVEKIIFRIQEDINKEKMILFAGERARLQEPQV